MKRSDQSIAVYIAGAVGLAATVGAVVLVSMDRVVPPEIWGVVLASMTGLYGWARGGTYFEETVEKVPAPPVAEQAIAIPVPVSIESPFEVPVADELELARRQTNER